MLILYEANIAGQYRVGYVQGARGDTGWLPRLSWENVPASLVTGASLTDDPALTGASLTYLPAGTEVLYLTTMYNDEAWDYVETVIDGKTARGFLPSGALDTVVSEMDAVDEMTPVDQTDGSGGNG